MARKIFVLIVTVVSLSLSGWSTLPSASVEPPPAPTRQDCASADCQKKPALQTAYTPVSPAATGSDHFGYTWNDTYTTASWSGAWTDLTAANPNYHPLWDGTDEESDLIEEVNLPFSFKFYEGAYSKVYISSNGLIGFDASVDTGLASFVHYPIPHDYKNPQNFIALYWTDLKFVEAYYGSGSDGRGSFFAVEWFQSTDSKEQATLTFEVKLYSNGDIAYLYDQLTNAPDGKSIGIEDPDGVDGLQYLLDASGPNEDQVILFDRPDPSRRVKLFPRLQSDFNIGGYSTFQVKLRNTGDVTPEPQNDIFNLATQISDPDWTVSLYAANGSTAVGNHDANPLPDTNSLAQGATFTITLRVIAPADADVGARAVITLTAISSQDASKTATVGLVSAVPAPFAHAYKNSKYSGDFGINLELVAPRYRINKLANNHYTGAVYIMNGLSGGNYMSMWENNVLNGTNLQYLAVDSGGNDLFTAAKVIADNTGGSRQDIQPVAATAPDGKVGIAWVRTVKVDDNHFKQNVHLAILNAKTDLILSGPITVTNDTTIYDATSYQYVYQDVAITATGDNRFYLAWRKYGDFGLGSITQEIYHAIYTDSGGVIKAKEMLTTPAVKVENVRPAMVAFLHDQEKVLLLFFQTNSNLSVPTNTIKYAVLNSAGAVLTPITDFYQLGQQSGSGLDGVNLQNDHLAVAWINHTQGRVNYAIIGTDLSKPALPNILANPDEALGWRTANFMSITTGSAGSAILTWLDESFKERIYYARVNDNGEVGLATPPMVFRYILPGIERELMIYGGYGNAAYIPIWRLMLPLIRKQ